MLKRLQLSTTNRPLDVIQHWRDEGMLLLDAPYQRGDVWGPRRRINLIRSLLLGIPIPSIIVNDRGAADWDNDWRVAVIDGRQRCTTILMFLDSLLAIPGEWVGESGSTYFKDLPISMQRRLRHASIGLSEGRLESVEQETEVFELVNYGGVPQGETDEVEDRNG